MLAAARPAGEARPGRWRPDRVGGVSRRAFGQLLRHWRARRGTSQLAVASEAGTSTRHLSFVETGRSQPSREMVVRLCSARDVPLRERNALLSAAGFAALYRETPLEAPSMKPILPPFLT